MEELYKIGKNWLYGKRDGEVIFIPLLSYYNPNKAASIFTHLVIQISLQPLKYQKVVVFYSYFEIKNLFGLSFNYFIFY